jgi:hypothetical protein
MGLLDKRNPLATRNSVIRAACVGAVGFFLFALIILIIKDAQLSWIWLFMLSFMIVAGAGVGALVDWQGFC